MDVDLHEARIRWFADGKLNVSVNCVDRHVAAGRGGETAIIFESDSGADGATKITFSELQDQVEAFAAALRNMGVSKGDRVSLYMPMIPEAAVAMLGCARVGAVHSVIFGGFSADAVSGRVVDCQSKVVITADG